MKEIKLKKQQKTVFVGLSGGVDSSVSAALLKDQNYDVVGVFMRTWHPDFLECNEEEERLDAMRVAAHLDIPFLTFDFEKEYKKGVADYMIAEYKAGRTPNPDVMCNKEVKFGAFMKKALSMGADFVATGHYARNKNSTLLKTVDPSKDQSYFLWTLSKEQLERILFPVGHLRKTEVRALAKKHKLSVAFKKDSQGICFLGDVDLKQFLKHYIKEKKGDVILPSEVEGQSKIIGHHDGLVFHTLGERHGFTITEKTPNDKPYYVVGKDVKKNILYVSQNSNNGHSNILKNYKIENINFPTKITNGEYTAQIRYHGDFLPCKVKVLNKDSTEVIFEKPVLIAPGQSIVIYDGERLVGGGVIV